MVVSTVDISGWIPQIAGLRNFASKLLLNFKWVTNCWSNALATVITAIAKNTFPTIFKKSRSTLTKQLEAQYMRVYFQRNSMPITFSTKNKTSL